jgi:hypothetical protein
MGYGSGGRDLSVIYGRLFRDTKSTLEGHDLAWEVRGLRARMLQFRGEFLEPSQSI